MNTKLKGRGFCSYCMTENVHIETVVEENRTGERGGDHEMCSVCLGIGLATYFNQNHYPVTRVQLSRAVRFIVSALKVNP